jgi:hypothetical protein
MYLHIKHVPTPNKLINSVSSFSIMHSKLGSHGPVHSFWTPKIRPKKKPIHKLHINIASLLLLLLQTCQTSLIKGSNLEKTLFQVEFSRCQRLWIDNGDPNPTTHYLLQVSCRKLNEFFLIIFLCSQSDNHH